MKRFLILSAVIAAPWASPALGQSNWKYGNTDFNWTTPSNWDAAVPNGVGASATFDDTYFSTGPTPPAHSPYGTINVNATISIGSLTFNNSLGDYTIGGANVLQFDNGSGPPAPSVFLTKNGTRTATITAQMLSLNGGALVANVNAGTLVLSHTTGTANQFGNGSTFTVALGATLQNDYTLGYNSLGGTANGVATGTSVVLNGGTLVLNKIPNAPVTGLNGYYWQTGSNPDSNDFASLSALDAVYRAVPGPGSAGTPTLSIATATKNTTTAGVAGYDGGSGIGAAYAGFDYSVTRDPTTGSTTTGLVGTFGSGAPFYNDGFVNLPLTGNGVDQIVARFQGKITITAGGSYNFFTTSDDGSVLFIDGVKVVDNNFYQGATERGGTIDLTAGEHTIDVAFYEGGGGAGLQVRYQGGDTGGNKVIIPAAVLSPNSAVLILGNDVLVKDSASTIQMSNSKQVVMGVLKMDPGAGGGFGPPVAVSRTLNVTGSGLLKFSGISFDSENSFGNNFGGLQTYNIVAGSGIDVSFGTIVNSDNGPVVLNWANSGKLIFDGTNTPNLDPFSGVFNSFGVPGMQFNVSNGRMVVVGNTSTGVNPIAQDSTTFVTVNLSGGAALQLLSQNGSGPTTDFVFNNPVNVSGSGSIEAATSGRIGKITLGSGNAPVTLAGGTTLTTNVSANTTLEIGGQLTGGTSLNPVALVKNGPGVLKLSNSSNDFVGATGIVNNPIQGLDTRYYAFTSHPPGNSFSGAAFATVSGVNAVYSSLSPTLNIKTGAANGFDYSNSGFGSGAPFAGDGFAAADNITAIFSGTINLPVGPNYWFRLQSDDGSVLYIDNNRIVDNSGDHGANIVTGSTSITGGSHSITVAFEEAGGGAGLLVQYGTGGTGGTFTTIPGSWLSNSVPAGAITVTQGVLLVSASHALGDPGNSVVVRSGGAIAFENAISSSNTIYIYGAGTTGVGAVDNLSGSNSFSGNIILEDKATIGATVGTLTLLGTVTNGLSGANTLNFNPQAGAAVVVGDAFHTNVIQDGGVGRPLALQMSGAGTLTLSRNNSYTGGTTVTNGTLVADGSQGANNVFGSGTVTIQAGTVLVSGQQSGVNSALGNNSIVINDKGTLQVNGTGVGFSANTTNYSGTSVISSGTINVGANTIANFNSATLSLAAPTVQGGLLEGFITTSNPNDLTANPGNGSHGTGNSNITSGIAMGQANKSTSFPVGQATWGDNQMWIYTGQIKVQSGTHLVFAENIDDSVRVYIDGVLRLTNDSWNNASSSADLGVLGLGPNGDGWHNFEVRLYNGGGGAGTSGAIAGTAPNWSGSFGFGVNTTGLNAGLSSGADGLNFTAPTDGAVINGNTINFRTVVGGPGLVYLQSGSTFNIGGVTGNGIFTLEPGANLNVLNGVTTHTAGTIGTNKTGSGTPSNVNLAAGAVLTIGTLDLDSVVAGNSGNEIVLNSVVGNTGKLVVTTSNVIAGAGGLNNIFQINRGTAILNGNGGTGTTGLVQVFNNGVLGGNGIALTGGNVSIGGQVQVDSGATITAGQGVAAGNSVGKLTISNGLGRISGSNFGTYVWKLGTNDVGGTFGSSGSTNAGTSFDQIGLTGGALDVSNGTLQLVFANGLTTITGGTVGGGNLGTSKVWKVIDSAGSNTGNNGGRFLTLSDAGYGGVAGGPVGNPTLTYTGLGTFSTFVGTGSDLGDIFLRFDPVPEASHVLVVCLLGLAAAGWIRRRRAVVAA